MSFLLKHLRVFTAAFLALTLAASGWTQEAANHFSAGLELRAHLGLPHRIMQEGIAMELACSPSEFQSVFDGGGDSSQWASRSSDDKSKSDRFWVTQGLWRDFGLIFSYTILMMLLGLRTWKINFPCGQALRILVVIVPVIVGLCDVAENVGALITLKHYPQISSAVPFWTAIASHAKWLFAFLGMILLGWSLVNVGDDPKIGVFLRETAALILLLAGFFGLVATFFPSMIPMTFICGMFAVVPLGFMLVFPDSWW